MKNILEYILFVSFSWIFRLFGLRISRKFASILALLFFYIIPIRKNVTIDNLKHAFPEYTDKKIKEIAFNCYTSFGITLIEILCLPWLDESDMKNAVSNFEIDLIQKKYDEGNGLIFLSAHLGNWEYLAASAGLQIGKKVSIIVKPQRNPYVNNWMNRNRIKWTNEVVPLGISIRNIYTVLLKKGIVALLADQRGPKDSIKLNFFGRLTSVYTGPAALSLKSHAPIVYVIISRQKDYSYKAEVTEIDGNNLPENFDEKVKVLSERCLIYLENVIRKYPEQWLWMHNRWKH